MTSLVSAIKRKLASILPFTGGEEVASSGIDAGNMEAAASSSSSSSEYNICSNCNEDQDERPRKRQRLHSFAAAASGTATPHLLSESTPLPPSSVLKLSKELFLQHDDVNSSSTNSKKSPRQSSDLLRLLPHDVLSHCLSYINTPSDRFGLQVSCSTLCKLSNGEEMLATLELGGDVASVTNVYSPFYILENAHENDDDDDENEDEGDEEFVGNAGVAAAVEAVNDVAEPVAAEDDNDEDDAGMAMGQAVHRIVMQSRPPPAAGGIILDEDTSVTACAKLIKYAAAGNMQAIYMIAMILCYCHENITEGLALLRHAASTSTHLPSIYALALILRDSRQVESDYYLNTAASLGYAPAWQEKLTAAEMRAQFGDLDAHKLVQYLDPPCLNKLLGRHYLECQRVRKHQTSHCWNPLCGRWAYKALRVENARRARRAMFHALLNEGRVGVGHGGNQHLFMAGNVDNNVLGFRQLFGGRNGGIFEPANANNNNNVAGAGGNQRDLGAAYRERHSRPSCQHAMFSIESLLPPLPEGVDNNNNNINEKSSAADASSKPSPLAQLREALRNKKPHQGSSEHGLKVSRMKMCSSCRRAKYCSKLCQVYDWRSGRHKMECQFL